MYARLAISITLTGGFFFTGLRTGSSDLSDCAESSGAAGFLDALPPAAVAVFLGLLALGGTALISTFSLNSSIYTIKS